MASSRIRNILRLSEHNLGEINMSFFQKETKKNECSALLGSLSLFKNIFDKELNNLSELVHYRTYSEGENIFMENTPGQALYIVFEGEVKITKNYNGEEKEIDKVSKGNFFGAIEMIANSERSNSAYTVKNSKLGVLFKSDIDEFVDKYPKEGVIILREFVLLLSEKIKINEEN